MKTIKEISKLSTRIRWDGHIEYGIVPTFAYESKYEYETTDLMKALSRIRSMALSERLLLRQILPKGIYIKDFWDIPFSGEYKSKKLSLTYETTSFKNISYYNR